MSAALTLHDVLALNAQSIKDQKRELFMATHKHLSMLPLKLGSPVILAVLTAILLWA